MLVTSARDAPLVTPTILCALKMLATLLVNTVFVKKKPTLASVKTTGPVLSVTNALLVSPAAIARPNMES